MALTSVTAFAFEDEAGTPRNWNIHAVAVCADAPSGLERMTAATGYDSLPGKAVYVACPDVKRLLGLGGLIEGAEGEMMLSRLNVDRLGRAVITAFEDETGTDANWDLRVYGICAGPLMNPADVPSLRATGHIPEPSRLPDRLVWDAMCPGGMQAIGHRQRHQLRGSWR
ncbi:hypothetical protein J5X84_25815 [Streptosporangiaceae bacterium NEAU-GS5]|nr:hypothetical protein [Streptosporangiaceae bacterium NEAU-GS5]